MLNDLDVNELNDRVEVELTKQKKLIPIAMFGVSVLMVVLFSVISYATFNEGDTGLAVFMGIFGGFMALMMQGIGLLTTSGITDNAQRERLVGRAMSQMLRELPKRKNERRNNLEDEPEVDEGEVVMLGDDGELKRDRR